MGLHKDVEESVRIEIFHFLLQHSKEGKLQYGKLTEAATKFNVSKRTISRLWKSAHKETRGTEAIKVVQKRKARVWPKMQVNQEVIESVNFQKRGTIRSLSESINISKSTVGRWVKENLIRVHTNAIKPELTAPNKMLRLCFSLQAIEFDNALKCLKFKAMDNVIHIDEKWFYLTKNTQRYYMTHREEDPYRYCKSKKFIPKVMFMCAVCRPIFSAQGSVLFDGKIGMWPFTEEVKARRNSKLRPAGTMELKPIESITKEVIKDCLVKKILPAIKSKWPAFLSKNINIQQDNARPHITDCDSDFRAVARADGFNIKLVQQPANSPDLNINDLGFFRAIQSLQQKYACRNTSDLVNAVMNSYNALEAMTLNKVFITLQSCMQEILKGKGCNRYKIPHMGKDALILHNELPRDLEVPMHLVKESFEYLLAAGHGVGNEQLLTDLGMHIS